MASRSSKSSKTSSRPSNTSRSTSTYTNHHAYPPLMPSPAAGHHSHDHGARSLRDIQEEIEACDLQIANAETTKQHALRTIRNAEAREQVLAQDRAKAQRKRVEMMQRLNMNVLNTGHGSAPVEIVERSPDDYANHSLTPKTPKSSSSESSKSSKSSKSKRVQFEVVGISRSARPKTIWGTPAWA